MPEKRLLLLDVGNTSTKIGLAGAHGLSASFSLPTDAPGTPDSWGLRLETILSHAKTDPADVAAMAVCSVVPPVDACLRAAADRYFRARARFAAKDLPLALENRYTRPQEVGADRLVAALAARRLFPEAQAIIVVDFGTATTFDCVSGHAYLGGLICPGVQSSARALASGTAKLPQINLVVDGQGPVVGRSTSESLSHGFVYGFAAMTEGVCRRLRDQFESDPLVVATGGFAQDLSLVCPCLTHVLPDLLLEGLRLAWLEAGGKF